MPFSRSRSSTLRSLAPVSAAFVLVSLYLPSCPCFRLWKLMLADCSWYMSNCCAHRRCCCLSLVSVCLDCLLQLLCHSPYPLDQVCCAVAQALRARQDWKQDCWNSLNLTSACLSAHRYDWAFSRCLQRGIVQLDSLSSSVATLHIPEATWNIWLLASLVLSFLWTPMDWIQTVPLSASTESVYFWYPKSFSVLCLLILPVG